jgi:hypothetical protein
VIAEPPLLLGAVKAITAVVVVVLETESDVGAFGTPCVVNETRLEAGPEPKIFTALK